MTTIPSLHKLVIFEVGDLITHIFFPGERTMNISILKNIETYTCISYVGQSIVSNPTPLPGKGSLSLLIFLE